MDENQAYQAALDYLYHFIDYSRTHQQNLSPENFNLDRMHIFVETLSNPHQAYPTIHIAGTKGKGSVAVFCSTALQAGGYKVGLYTSPHLHDFTERIQINGQPISKDAFATLVEEIKPFVEDIPGLTSYELQTALAFWYFARQGVDIAVIEVGLGGRLDSTNIITPLVSVITSISLDHTFILGDTIAEIAAEKGGIIKSGVPVVSAPQKAVAQEVLTNIAKEHNSPFTQIGDDIRFRAGNHSLEGQGFTLWRDSKEKDSIEFRIGLLGAHQIENAVTAYAALDIIRQKGIKLSDADIQQSFAKTTWPGRFEVFGGQPPIIFDVAHNRYSAQVLWETVETYFPGKPVTLLFGALSDKDIPGMFKELLPHVETMIAVQPDHPRATPLEKLKELASPFSCEVELAPEMSAVLDQARELAGEDGVILVTGSLTTVGELRANFRLE